MSLTTDTSVDNGKLSSGQYVGCTELSGDLRDEVGFADRGEETTLLSGVELGGGFFEQYRVPNFDRLFAVKKALPADPSIVSLVKLVSANRRRATLFAPNPDLPLPIVNLPRKVIVSTGVFLESNGSFSANLLWQDIRKGLLMRQSIAANSSPVSLGRVALRSSLLQSQYVYRTAK